MAWEPGAGTRRPCDGEKPGLSHHQTRDKLAGLSVSKAYRKEGDINMAWENPITTWGQAGQTVPGAADFNRIEGNTQYLKDTLDSHKAENATLDNFGHVKHAVLTVNLDTTWSGTAPPYTKTVSVSGILATDTPIIDVVMSGTYSTDEARIEAWGYIYRAVTGNGTITFYATEKPTVDIPIQIKVVR